MKRILPLLSIMLLVMPLVAHAQLKSQNPQEVDYSNLLGRDGMPRGGFLSSIGLDPSRFRMSHTYSFSVMNFGGHSFSQGVYLNSMSYQVSDPVRVNVEWGIQHQPFGGNAFGSQQPSNFFLSGASVEYKPSQNFKIDVQYSSYPTMYHYQRRGSFGSSLWSPYQGRISADRDDR